MQLYLALVLCTLCIQIQLNTVPVAVNHVLNYIHMHRILSGQLRITALQH